jgi:hypothetical protein
MTWFEKEYEKATKEIEHYDFNIKKGMWYGEAIYTLNRGEIVSFL